MGGTCKCDEEPTWKFEDPNSNDSFGQVVRWRDSTQVANVMKINWIACSFYINRSLAQPPPLPTKERNETIN